MFQTNLADVMVAPLLSHAPMKVLRWFFSRNRFILSPSKSHFEFALANPNPGVAEFVLGRTSSPPNASYFEFAFQADSLPGFQALVKLLDPTLSKAPNWFAGAMKHASLKIIEYLLAQTALTFNSLTPQLLWPSHGFLLSEPTPCLNTGSYPPPEPKRERFNALMKLGCPFFRQAFCPGFYEWADIHVLREIARLGWVPNREDIRMLASPKRHVPDYIQRLRFSLDLGSMLTSRLLLPASPLPSQSPRQPLLP